MTPKQIRDYIIQFVPEPQIGTYVYENGYEGVAIAVGNVPNCREVRGIEFIIPNFPHITGSYRGGCFTHRKEKWDIEIVNHGDNQGDFYTVIDILMRVFPRSRGLNIPQADPVKSFQRYRLTFIHSEGYRNYPGSTYPI